MIDFRPHLSKNRNDHLEIGGFDTVKLAEKYGTPLYVTDGERIIARYREVYNSFSTKGYDIKIKYACKANSSLAILKLLKHEGAGVDVLSEGEITVCLNIGFDSDDLIFTGNNKTNREISFAIEKGITLNIDSLHELDRIKRISHEKNKTAKVSFRINPAVSPKTHPHLATGLRESKFGIQQKDALAAYKMASEDKNIRIEGIHMHIGSQILDTKVYEDATSKLMQLVCSLKKELNINLGFIDVGGGFGIPYNKKDGYVSISEFADKIIPIIDDSVKKCGLKKPVIYVEPGRYIVADSTILLTAVNTVKETPYKKFIGVDAGFNTLARPLLYDAYHEVIVANRIREKPKEVVTIAGNVCESGDILAHDRSLPEVQEGDILALLDTGAYGLIMASQYNMRPRPAALLVMDSHEMLIRSRETFEDIVDKEILPEELRY